jgi:hypothetical protein
MLTPILGIAANDEAAIPSAAKNTENTLPII